MSLAECAARPVANHPTVGRLVPNLRLRTSADEEPHVPPLINSRYRVTSMIGSGSFGHIFEADDIHTHEQVAVKFEAHSLQYPQLAYETRVLKLISGLGIPKIIWFA